jgi:hypothetical protein
MKTENTTPPEQFENLSKNLTGFEIDKTTAPIAQPLMHSVPHPYEISRSLILSCKANTGIDMKHVFTLM